MMCSCCVQCSAPEVHCRHSCAAERRRRDLLQEKPQQSIESSTQLLKEIRLPYLVWVNVACWPAYAQCLAHQVDLAVQLQRCSGILRATELDEAVATIRVDGHLARHNIQHTNQFSWLHTANKPMQLASPLSHRAAVSGNIRAGCGDSLRIVGPASTQNIWAAMSYAGTVSKLMAQLH